MRSMHEHDLALSEEYGAAIRVRMDRSETNDDQ
jgi:hypothetical protein